MTSLIPLSCDSSSPQGRIGRGRCNFFTGSQKTLLFLHSSYGLMRQTKSLPTSWSSLVRWVFAAYRQYLLGNGPSRHYLCNPCIGAWIHTPSCPPGAFAHFFPGNYGLTPQATRSAHDIPAMRLPTGSHISGLQSFVHLQAPILVRPPDRTHRQAQGSGRPGRLHHASPGGLPLPGCGITTRPSRATDAAGLAPAGLQPCRLLLPASWPVVVNGCQY